MNYIYKSYKIVDKVLREGVYSQIFLNQVLKVTEEKDKKIITKIVYGVLENNLNLNFKISQLCEKKPKNSILNLLKVGIYLLEDTNKKDYAIINECVKIAKSISKNTLTGFVNSTLRKSIDFTYTFPTDEKENLSVTYSYPLWLVNKIYDEYSKFGKDVVQSFFKVSETDKHVRLTKDKPEEFEKVLKENSVPFEKTPMGYILPLGKLKALDFKDYVVQNISSMKVVDKMGLKENSNVLDVCSAPGGKTALIAQISKKGQVLAMDIHPSRLNLVRNYCEKLGIKNFKTLQNDGEKLSVELTDQFDFVLVDAPCSGFGIFNSKPEIKMSKDETNIDALSKIQEQILSVSSRYVKKGGSLIYSTCTIFQKENSWQIENFLKTHSDFELVPLTDDGPHLSLDFGIQLIPTKHQESFFISKLRRL